MRLNPDCIRDILVSVEKDSNVRRHITIPFGDRYPELQKYSYEELAYHIRQCNLSGFLLNERRANSFSFFVDDLTPAGHEFLSNIRSDTNWNKAKEAAKKVGTESLSILARLAGETVWNLITKP